MYTIHPFPASLSSEQSHQPTGNTSFSQPMMILTWARQTGSPGSHLSPVGAALRGDRKHAHSPAPQENEQYLHCHQEEKRAWRWPAQHTGTQKA